MAYSVILIWVVLRRVPDRLTELDRHGTRDYVDDRVVAAVMVPATHEARARSS